MDKSYRVGFYGTTATVAAVIFVALSPAGVWWWAAPVLIPFSSVLILVIKLLYTRRRGLLVKGLTATHSKHVYGIALYSFTNTPFRTSSVVRFNIFDLP